MPLWLKVRAPHRFRRRFLCTAGAALGAALTGCQRTDVPGIGAASPLLDAHLHATSAALASWLPVEADITTIGGSGLLARLDALGAERAFALSSAYLYASDFQPSFDPWRGAEGELDRVRAENDFTADECSGEPRLVPFCSLNPKRDYAVDELARCVEDRGMRGLKLHFWNSNLSLRDPTQRRRLSTVLTYAGERQLPVLVHVLNGEDEGFGRSDAQRFVEVLSDAGAPPLCLAHLCGAGGYKPQVAELFDAFSELRDQGWLSSRTHVELSATLTRDGDGDGATSLLDTDAGRARLAEQLQRWGLDTVLWGSDNGEDYLIATRRRWPLSSAELDQVLANTGTEFVA